MASKQKQKTVGAGRAKRSRKASLKADPKSKQVATRNRSTPRGYDGPVIHCGHTRIAAASSLRPHPQNPNTHSESQIKLLAKNIDHMGWRHPIIVSRLTGFIVAGHARLRAAELLGLSLVPVDEQDFSSETEERAYLIADNRIAELAEIDTQVLKDLLQELDTGAMDLDMDLTGFDAAELERLMTQFHQEPEAPEDFSEVGEDIETAHQCPKCGYKWSGGQ